MSMNYIKQRLKDGRLSDKEIVILDLIYKDMSDVDIARYCSTSPTHVYLVRKYADRNKVKTKSEE